MIASMCILCTCMVYIIVVRLYDRMIVVSCMLHASMFVRVPAIMRVCQSEYRLYYMGYYVSSLYSRSSA